MNKQISLGFLLLLTSIAWSGQQPKLTIIASVENSDEYIEDFLFRITRQTIFNDCELILHSLDSHGSERAVINRYIKQYPQISYIVVRSGIDLWHARTIAHAPYIIFLKSGEIFQRKYFQNLLMDQQEEQIAESVIYDVVLKNDKMPNHTIIPG